MTERLVVDKFDRLSDEEIKGTARKVITNEIYISFATKEEVDTWDMVFPILFWLDITEDVAKNIGAICAPWEKRARLGVNNKPMFFTCQLIHIDDANKIADRIKKLDQVLNA